MNRPVLKRGTPRKEQTKVLQQMLADRGLYTAVIDGDFGPLTEKAVQHFQEDRGLVPDGIVGRLTWAELARQGCPEPPPDESPLDVLEGFKGDTDWIHNWEGHRGSPYWPGGRSGVTLDPGVDLGHMGSEAMDALFTGVYSKYLTPEEIQMCLDARGYQGEEAQDYLNSPEGAALRRIQISRAEAMEVFPVALDPYWAAISGRFPRLRQEDVLQQPGAVHTAFASLAYNRGAWNRSLEILREPLDSNDLAKLGNLIMSMQQRHELRGIRRRRRAEGKLILDSL